jgi:hypothetical protein
MEKEKLGATMGHAAGRATGGLTQTLRIRADAASRVKFSVRLEMRYEPRVEIWTLAATGSSASRRTTPGCAWLSAAPT